jgi:hypothetical protein
MDALIDLWKLFCPDRTLPKVRTLKEIVERHKALIKDYKAWEELRVKHLPFPKPPLGGCRHIEPIRTASELIAEGKTCHHCIKSHAESIAFGEAYAYRILIPERASLLLKKTEDLWQISEIRGLNDRAVSPKTVATVHGWFALGKRGHEQATDQGEETETEPAPFWELPREEISLEDLISRITKQSQLDGPQNDALWEIGPYEDDEPDAPEESERSDKRVNTYASLYTMRAAIVDTVDRMELRTLHDEHTRLSSLLRPFGIPTLDCNSPSMKDLPPKPGSTILVDSDWSDTIVRDYAANVGVKMAYAGSPTLLVDPFRGISAQVERMLTVWSGIFTKEGQKLDFTEDEWLSFTWAASFLTHIPLVTATSCGLRIASLRSTIQTWQACNQRDKKKHESKDEDEEKDKKYKEDKVRDEDKDEARGVSRESPLCNPETAAPQDSYPDRSSVPVVMVTGAADLIKHQENDSDSPTDLLYRLSRLAQELNVFLMLFAGEDFVEPSSAAAKSLALRLSFRRDRQLRFKFPGKCLRPIDVTVWNPDTGYKQTTSIEWEPKTGMMVEMPAPLQ